MPEKNQLLIHLSFSMYNTWANNIGGNEVSTVQILHSIGLALNWKEPLWKTTRIIPHGSNYNGENTIPNWCIMYNTQVSNYYVLKHIYFMNLLPFYIVRYYIVHTLLKCYGNNWNICHTLVVYSVELTYIFNIFIHSSKTPFIF